MLECALGLLDVWQQIATSGFTWLVEPSKITVSGSNSYVYVCVCARVHSVPCRRAAQMRKNMPSSPPQFLTACLASDGRRDSQPENNQMCQTSSPVSPVPAMPSDSIDPNHSPLTQPELTRKSAALSRTAVLVGRRRIQRSASDPLPAKSVTKVKTDKRTLQQANSRLDRIKDSNP